MKMKIKRREEKKKISFDTLEAGELFEYEDRLMIKMASGEEDDAFDIDYNITVILVPSAKVTPLNATLTVEE